MRNDKIKGYNIPQCDDYRAPLPFLCVSLLMFISDHTFRTTSSVTFLFRVKHWGGCYFFARWHGGWRTKGAHVLLIDGLFRLEAVTDLSEELKFYFILQSILIYFISHEDVTAVSKPERIKLSNQSSMLTGSRLHNFTFINHENSIRKVLLQRKTIANHYLQTALPESW